MSNKNSWYSEWEAGGVIGVIITLAIPIGIIIWANTTSPDTSTTDTTETYLEYDEWEDEQRQNQADALEQKREQEFEGYTCTSDCSGHQAGYEWAQENGICNSSYSDGNSNSFNEGVRSFAANGC